MLPREIRGQQSVPAKPPADTIAERVMEGLVVLSPHIFEGRERDLLNGSHRSHYRAHYGKSYKVRP